MPASTRCAPAPSSSPPASASSASRVRRPPGRRVRRSRRWRPCCTPAAGPPSSATPTGPTSIWPRRELEQRPRAGSVRGPRLPRGPEPVDARHAGGDERRLPSHGGDGRTCRRRRRPPRPAPVGLVGGTDGDARLRRPDGGRPGGGGSSVRGGPQQLGHPAPGIGVHAARRARSRPGRPGPAPGRARRDPLGACRVRRHAGAAVDARRARRPRAPGGTAERQPGRGGPGRGMAGRADR